MTGAAVMAGHNRTVVAFNIKRRCAGQRALSPAIDRCDAAEQFEFCQKFRWRHAAVLEHVNPSRPRGVFSGSHGIYG